MQYAVRGPLVIRATELEKVCSMKMAQNVMNGRDKKKQSIMTEGQLGIPNKRDHCLRAQTSDGHTEQFRSLCVAVGLSSVQLLKFMELQWNLGQQANKSRKQMGHVFDILSLL